MLAPPAIGPFSEPLVRRLVLDALQRARPVGVRDALPADYHPSVGHDDNGAASRLAAEIASARLTPEFPDPVAANKCMVGLDLFQGSRRHACIAALSSGLPVLQRRLV